MGLSHSRCVARALFPSFLELSLTPRPSATQLAFFGHSDWGTRDPKRAKDLIRRIQRHETPWWFKLTTHFRDYTVWDDIVLLTVLVLLCTTIWGAYMTTGLWLNPDTFTVHTPTEWDTISFALGISASCVPLSLSLPARRTWLTLLSCARSLIFSFARIPEFISGERRSKRSASDLLKLASLPARTS